MDAGQEAVDAKLWHAVPCKAAQLLHTPEACCYNNTGLLIGTLHVCAHLGPRCQHLGALVDPPSVSAASVYLQGSTPDVN